MTDDRAPGELLRAAVHESAHALAALELGRGVASVSIRSGPGFGGACLYEPTSSSGAVAHPHEWRRLIEVDVLILLAGHLAETTWVFPEADGLDPDEPDVVRATRLAKIAVRRPLSAAQAEMLAPLETFEMRGDGEAARAAASELTPAVELWLAWMHAETRRLVRGEGFQARLRALVPVLLEATVLSGEQVRDVIRYADRGFAVRVAASK